MEEQCKVPRTCPEVLSVSTDLYAIGYSGMTSLLFDTFICLVHFPEFLRFDPGQTLCHISGGCLFYCIFCEYIVSSIVPELHTIYEGLKRPYLNNRAGLAMNWEDLRLRMWLNSLFGELVLVFGSISFGLMDEDPIVGVLLIGF